MVDLIAAFGSGAFVFVNTEFIPARDLELTLEQALSGPLS